jgi:hypothetical protein
MEIPNLVGQIINKATQDRTVLPNYLKLELADFRIVLIYVDENDSSIQVKLIAPEESEKYTGIDLPWMMGGPITEVRYEANELEVTQNYSTSFTASFHRRNGQPELRLSYD